MQKVFISANQLLEDAFELGNQILDDNFQPDLLIGVWRGGAPIAIAIHELLARTGINTNHMPVRTQLYKGVDQRNANVEITGLDYIAEQKNQPSKLLLIDDVFDSGQTMAALVDQLSSLLHNKSVDIRIATVWYKPERNETAITPDYFVHTSNDWLVFPHELCGLNKEELLTHKRGIETIKDRL